MTDIELWQGYDIIGDVHGCAHTLEKLLEQMGYARVGGVWRHPQRQALFLGDIIDRGPRIREALLIVRDMVEAGTARCIMGNHEFNALGWVTPAPAGSGRSWVREIPGATSVNPGHPAAVRGGRQWDEFLDWFWTCRWTWTWAPPVWCMPAGMIA